MKTKALATAALLFLASSSGCGTIYRESIKRPESMGLGMITVYPATVIDLIVGTSACAGESILLPDHHNPILVLFVYCPLQVVGSLIDLPISLVTDTLLLPCDLWIKRKSNTIGVDLPRQPVPRSEAAGR